MKTLKQIINRYMLRVSCVLGIVILCIMIAIQIKGEHDKARTDAEVTIEQIKVLLSENQKELVDIKEEYRKTCLNNAETVARLIESNDDIIDDIEELKEIADIVEVDEIHIFDTSGKIIFGTHPEYYGLTFDSGEQIAFFKPMLENKNLKLVQDITPNTAEGRSVQYSAVWSENQKYIVQVGMEPTNVAKVTKKNELSYIFSLFRVNSDASYYAIDAKSGEIIGSSNLNLVGYNVYENGFKLKNVINNSNGFHIQIDGTNNFCVFKKVGSIYIGRVITANKLYQGVVVTSAWIFITIFIVVIIMSKVVVRYMNKYVVDKISNLNEKLKSIADGNLNDRIEIKSSVEFLELSNYVNYMIKSLVDSNKKLSYALSKTNMYIATYEYGEHSKKVRYTEYLSEILSLDNESMEKLAGNVDEFKEFMWDIMENPVPNEKGIYQNGYQYLRIEEIKDEECIFGVAVDVTNEITKRIKAENERDVDVLTGLYNRRGMDTKLEELFKNPEALGCSAIVMIDADGLKKINDTYGHEKGDMYLKAIGDALADINAKNVIVARQGGDEFVLFIYGYDTIKEVERVIEELENIQTNNTVSLDKDTIVSLKFSYGYSIVDKNSDYQVLLSEADKKMYQNKMERKKLLYEAGK